jgi:hypothetical protein
MAEYIDRQDLIKFLDNVQQPKMPITEGFKYITIGEAIKVVLERPTADVIERSKINDIKAEIDKLTVYHTTEQGSELISKKAVQRVFNLILNGSRDIGE